uniref:restriction endonuclease subunit S n=1 Tax=Cellvibrio fontiphilus TaxID=1815559 RepID=UPI002B4BBC99|nr:restriction endonuclease subunit S [Cellvibrio fontiphilus]
MSSITLPEGWLSIKIADVSDVQGGKRLPKGSEFATQVTAHPYLRVTDFGGETVDVSNLKYIDDETFQQIKNYIISKNDLYISIAGTIGLVGDIPEQLDGANLTENAAKICNIYGVEKVFLKRYLNSSVSQSQFDDKTVSSGQPKLALFRIRDCDFPLPPLAEQQQIAQKLDELLAQVDTLKTRLDAIPNILKRFRQSVLAAAVSGRLTEEWRGSNKSTLVDVSISEIESSRQLILGKKCNSKIHLSSEEYDIPESWKWVSLDFLAAKIVDGTHHTPTYVDDGVPFISVKDIKDGRVNFEYTKFISSAEHTELTKRCNPEAGDLLITKSGTIGRTAIVPESKEFSLFVSVALIKPISTIVNMQFVDIALKKWVNEIDVSSRIVGTAIKNLHLQDMRVLAIPFAPLEEQTEIVRRVEQLFAYADQIEQRVKDAQARVNHLTQSILAKAFRGELTADWRAQNPELISGENSAAALLERIKAEREAAGKSKRKVKA